MALAFVCCVVPFVFHFVVFLQRICSLTLNDGVSLGVTLTDALDDLIGDERIDPQLAMKVLTQFDRVVAETLQEKVKARLTFKVNIF